MTMKTCNCGGYCEYRFQEGSRVGCKYESYCDDQRPIDSRSSTHVDIKPDQEGGNK